MKKVWLLTLCLLLWALPARAQVLPLFADGGTKQFADYAYTPDYTCDVWVYAPGAPADTWLLQCIEAGYTVEKTQVEGYDVYRAADRKGQYALLFPNYSGAAMLMVQKGILYTPDAPTPHPCAHATAHRYPPGALGIGNG